MQKVKARDSNLFAIDIDAITKVLAEANEKLIARKDELIAAMSRVPDQLQSADQIDRGKRFAAQLEATLQDCRNARLADGAPLRRAAATVRAFFAMVDQPLRDALGSMRDRLTDAALRTPSHATAIGVDYEGTEFMTTPAASAAGDVELVWTVAGFERGTVDLSALRDDFTDAVILAACKKHLAQHRSDRLTGVIYKQTAK